MLFDYDDVGGKIKTFARVLKNIGIFISCVVSLSVILIPLIMWKRSENVAGLLIGVFIIIVGPFLSWAFSLLLYGFGELVENSTYLKIPDEDQESRKAVGDTTWVSDSQKPAGNDTVSSPESSAAQVNTSKTEVKRDWFCPDCGKHNSADSRFCSSCGLEFFRK